MSVNRESLSRVDGLGLGYLGGRAVEALLEAEGLEGTAEFEERLFDAVTCVAEAARKHRARFPELARGGYAEARLKLLELESNAEGAEIFAEVAEEKGPKGHKGHKGDETGVDGVDGENPERPPRPARPARPVRPARELAKLGPRYKACEKCGMVRGVPAFPRGSDVCRPCLGQKLPGGRKPKSAVARETAAYATFEKAEQAARLRGRRYRACAKCFQVRGVNVFEAGEVVCRICKGLGVPGGPRYSKGKQKTVRSAKFEVRSLQKENHGGKKRIKTSDEHFNPLPASVVRRRCSDCEELKNIREFPQGGSVCVECLAVVGRAPGGRAGSLAEA